MAFSIAASTRPFSTRFLVLLCLVFVLVRSSRLEPQPFINTHEDLPRLLQRASGLDSVEKDIILEVLADRIRSGAVVRQPNNGTGDVHEGIPDGVECEAVTW